MRFTLQQEIPSKKNTMGMRGGRMYQSKPKELEKLAWNLKTQRVRMYDPPMEGVVALHVHIKGNDRFDLVNQVGTICDLLQDAGIVKNDRAIKNIHATKEIGKSPSCLIQIYEADTTKTS